MGQTNVRSSTLFFTLFGKIYLSLNPHRSSIRSTDFLHVSQSQHSLPIACNVDGSNFTTPNALPRPKKVFQKLPTKPTHADQLPRQVHLHLTSSPASPRVPFQRLVSDFLPPTKGQGINSKHANIFSWKLPVISSLGFKINFNGEREREREKLPSFPEIYKASPFSLSLIATTQIITAILSEVFRLQKVSIFSNSIHSCNKLRILTLVWYCD